MTGKELFDALEFAHVQAGQQLFAQAWIKADAATQQAFDIAAARLTKAASELNDARREMIVTYMSEQARSLCGLFPPTSRLLLLQLKHD